MFDTDKNFRLAFIMLGTPWVLVGMQMFYLDNNFLGVLLEILGLGLLSFIIPPIAKRRRIKKHGEKFSGKIYRKEYVVSNINSVDKECRYYVHYFDRNHDMQECVFRLYETKSNIKNYAIGRTIDFYEYNMQYLFISGSVRDEILTAESQLLDVNAVVKGYVTIVCPKCNFEYRSISQYAKTCPMCGETLTTNHNH